MAGPSATLAPLTANRCAPAEDDAEVIVCARTGESPYRLKALTPPPVEAPGDPLALALPGGGEARLHAIQSNVGGFTGQGLATTLRSPLGRKRKTEPR